MTDIEKYRMEFEDHIQSDPDFNYSPKEFYKWLVDYELTSVAIEELTRVFEEELDFAVHLHEQDGVMGAELEDWTRGGVDMIMWIHPFTPEQFVEIAESFDVDEQIDVHRQAADYRSAFTHRQSVHDFEEWEQRLLGNIETLKNLEII
jgi:chlorite dismutase